VEGQTFQDTDRNHRREVPRLPHRIFRRRRGRVRARGGGKEGRAGRVRHGARQERELCDQREGQHGGRLRQGVRDQSRARGQALLCVFLFPRLARMAICDIEDENTRHNSGGMVLCGIAEGVAKLKELIAGA